MRVQSLVQCSAAFPALVGLGSLWDVWEGWDGKRGGVLEGAGGFWIFLRGFGWLFKGYPEVPEMEIFSRGLQLVGRIELDQTWLWENFQQGEERRGEKRGSLGQDFPFQP